MMLCSVNRYGFLMLLFLLFLSCKNENKQAITNAETHVKVDTLETHPPVSKYPIWILEFQRLRQALYQNDKTVLSTFFDFPLSEEQSNGLVEAIRFNSNNDNSYASNISITTAEDIQKHYTDLFPTKLVKALLPIKSDSLLANNFVSSSTWKNTNDNAVYNTTVSYDSADATMSLFINAEYGSRDEKTESAVVYLFKLTKNNQLKFDKVLMAG